jgi:DNA invertase Pin-like site-specific DNA recombinase
VLSGFSPASVPAPVRAWVALAPTTARVGHVVVVVALDGLGRSLSGIMCMIEMVTAAGVQLRSLREGIETTTAVGRMLAGVGGS